MEPQSLQLDNPISDSQHDYPITLDVRHNNHWEGRDPRTSNYANGAPKDDSPLISQARRSGLKGVEEAATVDVETIKAKYLIGCDGAHSWTRTQLGLSLVGETTDHVWGVMDIVPLTNFRKPSNHLSGLPD